MGILAQSVKIRSESHKEILRMPNIRPVPKPANDNHDQHQQPMALPPMGHRHRGTIPNGSRGIKIPVGHGRLHHKVDRRGTPSHDYGQVDDLVHVEKHPILVRHPQGPNKRQ